MPQCDRFGCLLVSADAKRGLIQRALITGDNARVAGEVVAIAGELLGARKREAPGA